MTLPLSGALTMGQINTEFGRGTNLNSYRGTTWYTDAGATGTFSAGTISMSEFYGKRLTNPESYSQHTFVSSSQTFVYGYANACAGYDPGFGSFSPSTYRSWSVAGLYRNKGNNDMYFVLCNPYVANADSTFKRIEIVGQATFIRSSAKAYSSDGTITTWTWGLAAWQSGTFTVRIYY